MNHKYHIILGEQMILMRWPSEGVDQGAFMDAVNKKLDTCQTGVDLSIVGDLVPTDDPIENKKYSIKYLEEAFDKGIDNLPEFALWDYREGRFVNLNGAGKKGLQYR
ncbi:MAG: hypothetical protein LLG97_13615 [Deltaproteobacteria bacterium]|nr:hypothetical protein [Deltaproteobacteria bacterium]